MHERALAAALLGEAERLRIKHGAARVRAVAVDVGAFAGVDAELLRLALEELLQAGPANMAAVELRTLPLEARCEDCRGTFAVSGFCFRCPHCGAISTRIERGEELVLREVTLDMAENIDG